MAYKKFIKRGGNVYGPYVYKSRKENGKVITEYLGKTENSFVGKTSNKKIPIVLSLLGLIIVLSLMILFNYSLTGKVALQVQENYLAGEQVQGNLELFLKQGELLPLGTKIIIENGGEISEFFLSDLISENIGEGKFYAEGTSISGEGRGYGIIGERKIYPDIYFELQIIGKGYEKTEEEIEEAEKPTEEIPEQLVETETNQPAEVEETEETPIVSEPENVEKAPMTESPNTDAVSENTASSNSESSESSTGLSESSSSESGSSESENNAGITGEIVQGNAVEGKVSKDNPFTYELPEKKSAKIKPNSVRTDAKELSEDEINLKVSDSVAVVTTDYHETEQGFGEDYLTDEKINFNIDLSQFNLIAKQGQLIIRLVYSDEEISFISKNINVEGEEPEINETEIPETNITEISNETIPEIPATNITTENITEIPEQNITEIPTINVSLIENLSSLQYKAIAGRPVKWIKIIQTTNETDFIEIPKKSNNITIKTGDEVKQALDELKEYENTVDNADRNQMADGTLTGMVSLDINENKGFLRKLIDWFSNLGLTGNVIQENAIQNFIIETNDSRIVEVDKIVNATDGTNVAVEYYTAPSTVTEENLTNGKRITISADDAFNYTDILTYSLIDKNISMNKVEQVKLYWDNASGTKTKTNFTAYDLDSDGDVDYVEWIVPHLSVQVYEIIYITKAEHLDTNRTFISDIYNEVKNLDGIWSETINNSEYVRVTFEQILDNTKDITIYARGSEGSSIGVYTENSDALVTTFENVGEAKEYKVYLTNVIGSHDVFDLKVSGAVEFDYIVDPSATFTSSSSWNGTFANTTTIDGGANVSLDFFSLGDGSDGALTVSASNTYVNNYTTVNATNISAGATTFNVVEPGNFSVGDEILIIQMINDSGGTAGRFEFKNISAITGGQITVTTAFTYSYKSGKYNVSGTSTGIGGANTQVIRVPQYTSVTVNSGGEITAPVWDGWTGGIVVFRATGTILVNGGGLINASNKGYRGGISFTGDDGANGGESTRGLGGARAGTGASTAGGGGSGGDASAGVGGSGVCGGGGGGRDTAGTGSTCTGGAGAGSGYNSGGGGGGHGTWGLGALGANTASRGQNGSFTKSGDGGGGDATQTANGGGGGQAYGGNTTEFLFFGSGGGGSTGTASCGQCGRGGGIILVYGNNITIKGVVNASGETTDVATGGNGAPGAGAGGTVFLNAMTADIGTNNISSEGGLAKGGLRGSGHGGKGVAIVRYVTSLSGSADIVASSTNMYSGIGSYLQSVDAGQIMKWDNVTWNNFSVANTVLNLKVRSCDDSACSGETFVGEQNTAASNFTSSPITLNTTIAPNNRYFQINVSFVTSDTSLTPVLEDLTVEWSTANSAPSVPNLNQPLNATNLTTLTTAVLSWSNSTDADGNQINYSLEVDNNFDFSSITYSNYTIKATANTTGDTATGLSAGTTYYWRVLAMDGSANSSWSSPIREFTTNNIPSVPNLNQPLNATNWSSIPPLNWSNSTDPDGNQINYSLEVDNNFDFSSITYSNYTIKATANTTGDTPTSLSDTKYYWRVLAMDGTSNSSWSSPIREFTIDTLKPAVNITSPLNATNTTNSGIDINVTVNDSVAGLSTCWYTNNSGITNITFTCGSNITAPTWLEGINNVTVYANDSVNNVNSSSVSFTVDTTYPIFSTYAVYPANNTAYTFGGIKEFNVTLASTNGSIGLEFNGVNYTGTNMTATLFNRTISGLSSGNYSYKWWGYGSGALNNFNVSEIKHYTIANSTDNCDIQFNATSPIIYPTSFKVYTNCTYDFNITRGGTIVANNSEQSLGAGTYNFTVTRNDTANYTNRIDSELFTISQYTQTFSPLLNGATANLTITYPQQFNASFSGTNYTFLNISIISPINASLTKGNNYTYGVRNYTINFSLESNTNYTGLGYILYVNISEGTGSIQTWIKGARANTTGIVNQTYWVNATRVTSDGNISLYVNGTIVNSSFSGNLANYFNFTNVSYVNVTTILLASTNYTGSSETWWINITADTFYPLFANYTNNPANNSAYSLSNIYSFNSTINNTNGSVGFEFNGTNYTAGNLTTLFSVNITNISAGNYSYKWWGYGNGTSNNFNVSEIKHYTINKSSGNVAGYIGGTGANRSVDTQTTTMNFSANRLAGETTISLNLNGTTLTGTEWVSNNTPIGVGTYQMNVSISASENYTADSESWTLTVTQYVAPTTTATTSTTSGGGSSGGGSAAVSPIGFNLGSSSYETTLPIGKSESAGIKLTNTENVERTFSISQSNLDGVILLTQNTIKLGPRESANIEFVIVAPSEPGLYPGKVIVTSGGTRKEILVSININSGKSLYDIIVTIPKELRTIEPGENMQAQIDLLQAGIKESMDVTLNYIIKDYDGEIYLKESETIQVYDRKTHTKEFHTAELIEGNYVLGVELIYPDGVAVASSQFKIGETTFITREKIILAGLIIAFFVVCMLAWLTIKKYQEGIHHRRKR